MRVLAGKMKGRTFAAKVDRDLRPTADKVKAALFNILGETVIDAAFLDLYAGSGGVGMEAISRGAAPVVFVESDPQRKQQIEANLKQGRFVDQTPGEDRPAVRVLGGTAADFLKSAGPSRFDVIFVDPPYQGDEVVLLLPLLAVGDLLAPQGRIVVEHFHKKPPPARVGDLVQTKRYRYGDTFLAFYERG